jgi:hypothetical protein
VRLLQQGKENNVASGVTMIPRPKGTAGQKNFSLISKMKLNKAKDSDRVLYNDILVSITYD